MIKEKAKHLIEFSQGLCAKCILHYSNVRVSHKINTLKIQSERCDCQSHCVALGRVSCISFLIENSGNNISVLGSCRV